MGLSIHDKQLTIENGNAIIGALLGIIGLILVYLGFYSRFSTMNVGNWRALLTTGQQAIIFLSTSDALGPSELDDGLQSYLYSRTNSGYSRRGVIFIFYNA